MRHAAIPPAGSITALATPFRNGEVDAVTLATATERQIRAGTAALVVCGSTGEAPALTPAEHARVVRVVAEVAGGRIGVIAGANAANTENAIALAVAAQHAGADALLCAPPPYVKPPQQGLIAHVSAIGHATDLPIMLYDIPGRAAVAFSDETIARLFERDEIVALKDASGDLTRPWRLRRLCGGDLVQFTGDDATVAGYLAMGGDGCVSVTGNVVPVLCAKLHAAWRCGEVSAFRALADRLAPMHAALFSETNPIPLKTALAMIGLGTDELRLPLVAALAETRRHLEQVLATIMPAEDASFSPRRLALVK